MHPILAAAAGLSTYPVGAYLHEGAHAVAAKLLYKDPKIDIQVRGFLGWDSSFGFDPSSADASLSSLGKKLGKRVSIVLTTVVGPLADACACWALTLLFPTPLMVFGTAPYLIYLFTIAIQPFVNSITFKSQHIGDFGEIWRVGGDTGYALSFLATALIIAKTIEPLLRTYPPMAVLGIGSLAVLLFSIAVHRSSPNA